MTAIEWSARILGSQENRTREPPGTILSAVTWGVREANIPLVALEAAFTGALTCG